MKGKSMPKQEIEILISADGDQMEIQAFNFQGKGCKGLVEAFQCGTVLKSGPTSDYYRPEAQKKTLSQGK
jgi:hypothetical protein